ncbi:MAG TPA: hypothetical protein V6D19_12975 [Stenomitos sp.]
MNYDSAPNLILVKTALDKIRDQEMLQTAREGKAIATDSIIFTQDTATNAAVVTTVIGGGGYFAKRLDDMGPNVSANVKAPAPKTTLIAQFDKNVPVSKNFMADQQHSAVAKSIRQQTRTWAATRDRNAFNVFSLGFTTQLTIDGVPLFSNSHVNENGDVVDNLETGALADSTLNTTVVSLRNQLAQTGVKVGYEPDFLLTSNLNHKNACAVAKSVLRSGTGNNDQNYFSEYYPGMIVKYNAFLDDTSTTAYFVGARDHGVIRFEREGFSSELVDWKISAATGGPDAYQYLMRAREEVDSIEYSGLVGSTGL